MSIIAEAVEREPEDDPTRFDPSPHKLLGRALVIGFVLEVGFRGGLANAVVLMGLVLTVRVLWEDARLSRSDARFIAASAIVPALFLAVRSSPWLVWSNALAVVVLLTAAVLHARHGSILDSTPARLMQRLATCLARGVASVVIVRLLAPRMSTDQRDSVLRVSRGLLVAVPVLLVLVALLASADAVFASLVTPDVQAAPILGHVTLTLLLAPLVIVLAGSASADETESSRRGSFGVIELITMLGLVGAVLALFVVSQLVALTDAGDRLIESAGLTPAEYARSGFFQLCWATALLLGFLALVRALAKPAALGHPIVVALGAAVPTVAVGLVVVSLRRIALYDEAFGLTMLRLWVVGAAIWMGVVLVMTAARNLGVGSSRDWLVAGAGLAAVLLVMVANLSNPEAFVARHNLERARDGAELDVGYLATLSDDVVPAITNAIDQELDRTRRDELRLALRCGDDAGGVATLNLAARRATQLREEYCG